MMSGVSPGQAAPVRGAAIIFLLITLSYALVFAATEPFAPLSFAHWSLANAAPPVLLGYIVAEMIVPQIVSLMGWVRWAVAALTATIFSLVSYLATIVLLGLVGAGDAAGFFVQFFRGPALPWQLLQGAAYAVIALLIGLLRDRDRLVRHLSQANADVQAALMDAHEAAAVPTPLTHLLVRCATGMLSIDTGQIIRIAGADDYCEIITPTARHLGRISLNDCATRLAGQPFARVHRSHIVNLAQMRGSESAGAGRMLLTMVNGDTVITSRAGARGLRDRVV